MATIYEVVCWKTGKRYIGCTSGKLSKRMREHRCLLNKGTHSSKEMIKDWNLYGQECFEITAIQRDVPDSKDEKRKAETYWFERTPKNQLYNISLCSFAPPKGAPALAAKARKANGYRPSQESNRKRREAQLGIPKNHGHKISATKRRNRLLKSDDIV